MFGCVSLCRKASHLRTIGIDTQVPCHWKLPGIISRNNWTRDTKFNYTGNSLIQLSYEKVHCLWYCEGDMQGIVECLAT